MFQTHENKEHLAMMEQILGKNFHFSSDAMMIQILGVELDIDVLLALLTTKFHFSMYSKGIHE